MHLLAYAGVLTLHPIKGRPLRTSPARRSAADGCSLSANRRLSFLYLFTVLAFSARSFSLTARGS